MSVLLEVLANTFEETGVMEHISRLKICLRREPIAYTTSESINAHPSS